MIIPGKERWTSIKRVFRCLHGMIYFSIFYHGNYEDIGVHGFVDSNWVGDIDGRRSTNGYVFKLFGGADSWMSKKQYMVALSSTKVEYFATTHARQEVV